MSLYQGTENVEPELECHSGGGSPEEVDLRLLAQPEDQRFRGREGSCQPKGESVKFAIFIHNSSFIKTYHIMGMNASSTWVAALRAYHGSEPYQ